MSSGVTSKTNASLVRKKGQNCAISRYRLAGYGKTYFGIERTTRFQHAISQLQQLLHRRAHHDFSVFLPASSRFFSALTAGFHFIATIAGMQALRIALLPIFDILLLPFHSPDSCRIIQTHPRHKRLAAAEPRHVPRYASIVLLSTPAMPGMDSSSSLFF